MTPRRPFSPRTQIQSFKYALEGLKVLLQTQHNAWIQLGMGAVALFLSWWLEIGRVKFALIILCIELVLAIEAMNTAIEIVTNMISPHHSAEAKRAKDVAAAAVLLVSLAALAMGLIILGPPLLRRFQT